jgi:fructose-1,6-bisphosphatase/inositol monophosphatase family enzyme
MSTITFPLQKFFNKVHGEAISAMVEWAPNVRHLKYLESLEIAQETVFGDTVHDMELPLDKQLVEMFLENAKKEALIRQVQCEGSDEIFMHDTGIYDLYVDPCDGSLNVLKRGLLNGLPFTMILTAMRAGGILLKDVVAGIAIDLRLPFDAMTSFRHADGGMVAAVNNILVKVDQTATTIDGQHIYIFEQYYEENRRLTHHIVQGCNEHSKGWFRNPGSAGYEMHLVGAGMAASYVCASQKMHELGAAYLFTKAAGGVAIDFNGTDLGETVFDFNAQVPVILAATPSLAEHILKKVREFYGT